MGKRDLHNMHSVLRIIYYIMIKMTYSDAAYTQHLGFRHVGEWWSASCFDNEIYWEPDTGVTSSALVNGVLSFAIYV